MSVESIGAPPPEAFEESTIVISSRPVPAPDVEPSQPPQDAAKQSPKPTGLHSPPDSNNAMQLDASDSELSDLEDIVAEDLVADLAPEPKKDIGEIHPDHWSGTVPVFKPTMEQFEDFKLFMEKIDSYGMKSGIVKVIPPQEWKDSLPSLDDLVKTIRVREPIKQDIMGSNGTYRQVNILHQRSYNLPQWRQLCDQSEHQPPARRGERRANIDKPKNPPRTRAAPSSNTSTPKSTPTKKRRGRPGRGRGRGGASVRESAAAETEERPMTPVSPAPEEEKEKVVPLVEQDPGVEDDDDFDGTPIVRRMGFGRQAPPKTQSTSARRKYIKREGSAKIDEAAFKDWDYHMDVSDYTPERCEELERTYWKTLTYAPPLYGADLPGTLFDERTTSWNLNKLPNLLDVLGTKVPGVNTAYLYLGMWKATFAWHLEDVDLYSINYLHFGAPKQWYSISQKDARRFEAAMKNIWPTEGKACDQFLRHKAFLISPQHLLQHYNIKVNKVVSYPGEFVVTYPYGYHSGYNLGYNCAEAVNFALDSWLPMGKIAKRCECAQAQDSVWIDVYEIERKLRGESTDYEETEDEDDLDEDDLDDSLLGMPTPRSSNAVKIKGPRRKRKRVVGDKEGKTKTRKIRLRLKAHAEPPCCLCPNDIPGAEILQTDDGRKAHRMCALYLPETYVETVDGTEVVFNAANINKARLDLKCLYCRSKRGACFQCSQRKCARSYHATCAAAAGVFVEEADVPVFGEDGTEYKEQAFEFSCRFHRTKRDKKLDGEALEDNARVRDAAAALKQNDICQIQYYRGDIFAGVVVENRPSERTLLLDVIPNGDRVEIEWKWLLLPDPVDFHLPKASANALPMPTSRKAKEQINATKRILEEPPRAHEPFVEGCTWAEFHTGDPKNSEPLKVDLSKENQLWHYLFKGSTDTKPQYTDDPTRPTHNPKSNFLDSIPKPKPPPPATAPQPRRSYSTAHPAYGPSSSSQAAQKGEKPYEYKPRKPVDPHLNLPYASQRLAPSTPGPYSRQPSGSHPPVPLAFGTDPRFKGPTSFYSSDRFAPFAGNNNGFPQLPGVSPSPAQLAERYSPPQPKMWPASGSPLGPRSYRSGSSSSSGSLLPGRPSKSMMPRQGTSDQPPRAYQKYSFFHVHHNRDSARYRTPYAPWGGFTNGYEGNLRAHLMRAQDGAANSRGLLNGIPESLLHPLSGSSTSSPGSGAPSTDARVGTASSPLAPSLMPQYSTKETSQQSSPLAPSLTHSGSTASTSVTNPTVTDQAPSAPLHPAIRPQYTQNWQQQYNAAPGPAQPANTGSTGGQGSVQLSQNQIDASPVPSGAHSGIAVLPSPNVPMTQRQTPVPLPMHLAAEPRSQDMKGALGGNLVAHAQARRDQETTEPVSIQQLSAGLTGQLAGRQGPETAAKVPVADADADGFTDDPQDSATLIERLVLGLRRATRE